MRFGIGFILLLLALGGFAAYQGDRVGMSVGRKRLTIFGLRPKYTSRIVTVLTGIIIVSITMSSLLLISHSARQSLFGLEELQTTVSDLSRQVLFLEERQQSLTDDNANLQEQNSALYIENEALAKQQQELEIVNASLREEQLWLEGRVERITGSMQLIFQNLMQATLIYQANEVIASYVIEVPPTRMELTQAVLDVLTETNAKVLQAGAGEYTTGWGLTLEQVTFDDYGAVTLLTEEQHFEELVDSIWTESDLDSVVIQVISRTHTLEGSPVELEFRLFVDTVVFHQGETVDARIFNGQESGRDLLNQVWSWLEADVRQAAIERGLLGSPDGTVTAGLEPGTLYEVVERVSAAQGPLRVHAVATKDVRTSDELPLHFEYETL